MPMMRRPWRPACARASKGIWRLAPGVPCSQTMAGPRGAPYSAKLRGRLARTATGRSGAGRLTLLMAPSVAPSAAHGRGVHDVGEVPQRAEHLPVPDDQRAVDDVEHQAGDVVAT